MSTMECKECGGDKLKKFGKNRVGNQRFRCLACEKTFTVKRTKDVQLATTQKVVAKEKVVAATASSSIFDSILTLSNPTPANLPIKTDKLTWDEILEEKRQAAILKKANSDKWAREMDRTDIDYSIGDKDT